MMSHGEIAVVVDHGLLRPETALNLPEQTRLVLALRRIETTPEAELEGRRRLHAIRESGDVKLGGWRPRRDELHERG